MARPKGSKNKKTLLKESMEENCEIEALAEAKRFLPEVVRKLAAMAIDGNVQAAKLLLDKTLPTKVGTSLEKPANLNISIVTADAPYDKGITIDQPPAQLTH